MCPPSPVFVPPSVRPRRYWYGLDNMVGTNSYATATSGGEAGATTGFVEALLFRLDRLGNGDYRILGHKTNVSNNGRQTFLGPDNAFTAQIVESSTLAFRSAPVRVMGPHDVGRVHCALMHYDPSTARWRLWMDRHQVADGTAIAGIAVASAVSQVLAGRGGAPNVLFLANMTARVSSVNAAQMAAFFDAVRQNGNLPTSIAGVAASHRWSLLDALSSQLSAGQAIVDGQDGPASLADTTTGAANDAMAKIGGPVVRKIDAGVDGRKTYGAMGFGAASRYESATALRGHAAGSWAAAVIELDSAAGTEALLGALSASAGWNLLKSGGALTAGARRVDGTYVSTGPYAFAASDVGVRMLVGFACTGGAVRAYLHGVQQGSDVSLGGVIAPATVPLEIGSVGGGQNPATGAKVYAWGGGDGSVPTAQEWAGLQARFAKTGTLTEIPGKTTHLVDLTKDVVAAGPSAGLPATAADRVGSNPATRVGTPQLTRRTERLCGWETTPQLIGARNWSSANLLGGVTGLGHSAQPFWFLVPVIVHSKTAALQNLAVKSNAAATAGYGLSLSAASVFNFWLGTGSGTVQAPGYTLPDTELGRPLLLAYQWTGSVLQAFNKRARLGADVAAGAMSPFLGWLILGRHSDSMSNAATDAVTMLGVMGGIGSTLTLAEYQSAYDAFFAEDDLIEVPGKTSRLWSLKRDAIAAGGALASATDRMGSGEVLAINGSPSISNIYAHAA